MGLLSLILGIFGIIVWAGVIVVQRYIIDKQKIIIDHYKKHPLLHSEDARVMIEFCLEVIKENAVRYGDFEKAAKCRDLLSQLKEQSTNQNQPK
jgi:protein-arginine kinase activator protein McsA